ncbi:hypothetical protein AFUB_070530 [Aspergillus fumigatus A1163]|uniref:Uncharacterized protein n=1 Tax=Aspergillus fumigatus (strain CBS 144.89 / FGSC A1163 / CEA10) TaxID=451804 RepID=B0Y4W4_ASPFC|nr:hypothetical protein AFUB_070530 [Aspergillus fumigatus A1163]
MDCIQVVSSLSYADLNRKITETGFRSGRLDFAGVGGLQNELIGLIQDLEALTGKRCLETYGGEVVQNRPDIWADCRIFPRKAASLSVDGQVFISTSPEVGG